MRFCVPDIDSVFKCTSQQGSIRTKCETMKLVLVRERMKVCMRFCVPDMDTINAPKTPNSKQRTVWTEREITETPCIVSKHLQMKCMDMSASF